MRKFPLSLLLLTILLSRVAFAQGWFPSASQDLPEWARPDDKSIIVELRGHRPLWLVQAQAIKLVPNGKYNTITLKIEHIYVGPEKLNTATFDVSSELQGGKVLNLKLNELAIFRVYPSATTQGGQKMASILAAGRDSYRHYNFDFPVQQRSPKFPEALAHAKSIEQVARADRNKQVRLLRMAVKSSAPQLSAWAISTLAQSGLEDIPTFLLSLATEEQIPVLGRVALDKALEKLDTEGKVQWSDTLPRFNLWRDLVTSSANVEDGSTIVYRLREMARDEIQKRPVDKEKTYKADVSSEQIFEWLRIASSNSKWMTASRVHAATAIGELGRAGYIPRRSAWTYLLSLVESHPEFAASMVLPTSAETKALNTRLAQTGLVYITNLDSLTLGEIATLRALQLRAKSVDWKKTFNYYLEGKTDPVPET